MPLEQINVTLGTAGHIDHGKTALVKNLTGCDTDRLKEEKERGMSIELGFAPCTLANLQVGIVDVPGHEHFIKTMVAGATGVDGVILVVAADDGVMPQTREHLDILTLLGVEHGIVALTKIDRVDSDHVELVREDLRALLKDTFLESAPIVGVSNVTGLGFDRLLEALTSLVRSIQPRKIDGVFRMPVERTFSVKGYGTVVAGIPVSGAATIEDELVVHPSNQTGRLKAVQIYKRNGPRVRAGQCTALNVRQWDHNLISRGDVVATPGYFTPLQWFLGRLRLLRHERCFLKNGTPVKFHTGTSEVAAAVYLMEGSLAPAGSESYVQIRTAQPLVAGPRDRFILRALTPVWTIGGGFIIEGLPRRLKRNQPRLIRELDEWAYAVATESAFVEYVVKSAGLACAREADIAFRTKIPLDRVRTILNELRSTGRISAVSTDAYLHAASAGQGREQILLCLKKFHAQSPASPGIAPEGLQEAAGLSKTVFDALLASLKKDARIVERHLRLALAEHRETVADEDRQLLENIEALFRNRPFNPPDRPELLAALRVPAPRLEKALKILLEQDRLVKAPEDLLFHREAVDRAREILVAFIQKEGRLESVKFKYLLDTTRKYALPLLDYFDRIGLTNRINNTRFLRPGKNPGPRP